MLFGYTCFLAAVPRYSSRSRKVRLMVSTDTIVNKSYKPITRLSVFFD